MIPIHKSAPRPGPRWIGRRSGGRARRMLVALRVTAGACVGMAALTAGPAAAAGPQGCNYAQSGSGKYADTICWVDFSSFNPTLAASPAAQPMTVSLPGGYTASFTVAARPVPGYVDISSCVRPMPVPFWTSPSWPFGGQAYTGVAGEPGLLNTGGVPAGGAPSGTTPACSPPTGGVNLQLNNISVTDAAGQPVTGYGIVSTEAEASTSVGNEGIQWTSDTPLSLLDQINPTATGGCVGAQVTGFGTNTVTCVGKQPTSNTPSGYGTSLVLAKSPTFFDTASLNPSFILGTVYGFVTSKVELNKTVASRVNPSDSFDLSVASGATQLGSATTSTANTASTGEVTVLTGGRQPQRGSDARFRNRPIGLRFVMVVRSQRRRGPVAVLDRNDKQDRHARHRRFHQLHGHQHRQ